MPDINLAAWLSFSFVTTFTPGPNNISSTSMGLLHGYRKSLPYLLGIALGFFGIMLGCALIASTLMTVFPALENVLRVVGAGYILWLAWETWHAHGINDAEDGGDIKASPLGFGRGLLLQVLNPKAIVYGLTQYSTFLAALTGQLGWLILSATFFAIMTFSAISVWALFGAAIRNALKNQRVQRMVSAALSMLLVYTALDILGVFGH